MNCKICNSKHIKTKKVKSFKIGICGNCKAAYIVKIKENIESIYDKNYYKSWNILNEKSEKITRQVKYKNFNHLLNLVKVKKNQSILDIGCATGYLLDVAKKKGLKTYGVELSEWSSEVAAKNHNVFTGKIEDYKTEIKFDYITITDLLEHVKDPSDFMKTIKNLLAPKGKILVTTPNHNSMSRKVFGKNWFQYKDEHLYYFSEKSFEILAKKNGLKIKLMKANKKFMNYSYLYSQFTTYPTPLVTPFFKVSKYIIPSKLKDYCFKVPISGEILVVLENEA